jgi:hypothetical protein
MKEGSHDLIYGTITFAYMDCGKPQKLQVEIADLWARI